MGDHVTAAGWYADPWAQAPLRWWDGAAWTGFTESAEPETPTASARAVGRLDHILGGADRVAVVDVETTGLYKSDRVVEVAVVTMDATGSVTDVFESLVNPGRDVGPTWLHQVTPSMVASAPAFYDVAHHVASRLDGAVVVAHNLSFDQRMLTAELNEAGIDIHWGDGLDTLRVTGCKLGVACADRGVVFGGDAHSALADAHATAQLLLAVASGFPSSGRSASARPIEVRPMRVHTRAGSAEVVAPAPYLVALARGLHSAPDVAPYVALLDQAIADLRLTADERRELAELATDLGLEPATIARAHRDFLNGLIDAALDDHVVTEDEHDQLCRAAALLDVDVGLVAQRTDGYRTTAEIVTLAEGMQVCFTGTAVDGRGRELPRPELEVMARTRGLVPTKSVTKKACDLLVAADPSSRSGKAGKARQFGVPVASVADFLATTGPGSTLPVSRLSSAGAPLVCVDCGTSWLATRASSKPICASCRS
ncbi:exonuclease domain-containing protein [Aquihabitans daechungensis]|uniref:exonuclease domain-containing protein n=1 Tax=Aquihabitans daechungensis TaxID=1052257 RepID=UPI003BA2942F